MWCIFVIHHHYITYILCIVLLYNHITIGNYECVALPAELQWPKIGADFTVTRLFLESVIFQRSLLPSLGRTVLYMKVFQALPNL